MYNLLIAIAVGVGVLVALYAPGLLRLGEALVPALIAFGVAFVLLARKTARRMHKVMGHAQAALSRMPPDFDRAVREIGRAYPLGRWQFGLKSQLDAQVGMMYFLQREFARAAPYLRRALLWGPWVAGAMLGVVQYRKKDHAGLDKTFRVVLRKGKQAPLAWALWAYLLVQVNRREEAQRVLGAAVVKMPKDLRLKELLSALENGRKPKMRAFGEEWYQFHLERPPATAAPQQMQPRMRRAARRGRW